MANEEEVKLLGTWTSPYSRRVEIALKLKGVQYEYIEQDLKNKSDLLIQSNPVHQKIPVLLHNGKSIAESQIILEYIDETWKSNPILPHDLYERAVARFWCRFIDEKVTPAGRKAMMAFLGEEREKAEKEAAENLKTLEKQLEGKRFFGGEKFGVVDIAAIGIAAWTPAFQEAAGREFMTAERFPLIWRWAEEILSCGIFRENLPSKEQLVGIFKARLQAMASYFVSSYVSGLRTEIKALVKLSKPKDFAEVFEQARLHNSAVQAIVRLSKPPWRAGGAFVPVNKSNLGEGRGESKPSMFRPPPQQNSDSKILPPTRPPEQRRQPGMCYKCGDR